MDDRLVKRPETVNVGGLLIDVEKLRIREQGDEERSNKKAFVSYKKSI